MLHEFDQNSASENRQKDHFAQYQKCTKPLRSPEDWAVCFYQRDSWLDISQTVKTQCPNKDKD